MEALQIVILILGALLFTVSFFIPDKQVDTKEIHDKEERIFKELMTKEISDIRQKIDEVTEESIERAKENTQRQMERLTNEKMMAINEYSDTVMSEIHKNHEEAVFLYDMLNNKHTQVKKTAAELNLVMKQLKQAQTAIKNAKNKLDKNLPKVSPQAGTKTSATTEKTVKAEVENKKVVAKNEVKKEQQPVFEPMNSKELEVIIPPE